ncbi:Dolichyl-diphosphooligosaccharide--protein glycosyltransferase subunit 2 [Vitis vinifera]|uniref:Ribophorin II n=1 Tax=Vitis vinifera TaxID=29760 RepID=A0A438KDY2_VITVI|nr:Dolichyl-diphosphooligosaccharide--protein glycosyltransferase subunit 2 [Vitis vinifera]
MESKSVKAESVYARNGQKPWRILVLVLILTISIHKAASILDSHQPVALELFSPVHGSFGSLEESYDALQTFQILGIEKKPDISDTTCTLVSKTLGSSSSSLKDLFYALKVNGILKCDIDEEVFEGIKSRLQSVSNDASSLLDFYYSIGSLALIKEQASKVDVLLTDADGIFQSIKALSQSDGRWRYSSNNPESSTYAAGVAFEALARVVALASPEIDQSRALHLFCKHSPRLRLYWMVVSGEDLDVRLALKEGMDVSEQTLHILCDALLSKSFIELAWFYCWEEVDKSLKSCFFCTYFGLLGRREISTLGNDIVKLFDSIEKYDDGAFYFDEKIVDAREHHGPLSTTASVVRGLTAFADVTSGSLNIPGDKILGLAKFFLSVGIPGDAKDFFNQVYSLACLESNRQGFNPTDFITTSNSAFIDQKRPTQDHDIFVLYECNQVRVNTVLGSNAPPLTVKLLQAFSSSSKNAFIIENQELKFDPENAVHFLDALPENVDVGNYVFVFEILLHDPEHEKIYATGSRTRVPIIITGVIKVDTAEIVILDSDLGSVETKRKLDLAGENDVSLSANHLQKLRLSFQLATPLGHAFKPHQAFLKLKHETKVEHVFVVGSSGKDFAIVLAVVTMVLTWDLMLAMDISILHGGLGAKLTVTGFGSENGSKHTFEVILKLGVPLLDAFPLGVMDADFLGLVEKFFYLSGRYDIQLTVGDAVMENSFLQALGHVELDLPEPPEKAPRPPPQPVDSYLRYGPKAEIAHIFRAPEKLPPEQLSLAFLGLTILPLIVFLIGLLRLGVNLKNFPTSVVPATFAILFHLGLAAVLLLYVLFWWKAPFPPRLSISQVEICLRKRQMTGNIPTSPWEAAVGHF